MNSAIPEPWATAFTSRGLVDPRSGVPSLNAYGSRFESPAIETLRGMVQGKRRPSEKSIQAVADKVELDVEELRKSVNVGLGEKKPYQPPDVVNRLSKRQQDALSDLIRATAESQIPDVVIEVEPGLVVSLNVKVLSATPDIPRDWIMAHVEQQIQSGLRNGFPDSSLTFGAEAREQLRVDFVFPPSELAISTPRRVFDDGLAAAARTRRDAVRVDDPDEGTQEISDE